MNQKTLEEVLFGEEGVVRLSHEKQQYERALEIIINEGDLHPELGRMMMEPEKPQDDPQDEHGKFLFEEKGAFLLKKCIDQRGDDDEGDPQGKAVEKVRQLDELYDDQYPEYGCRD